MDVVVALVAGAGAVVVVDHVPGLGLCVAVFEAVHSFKSIEIPCRVLAHLDKIFLMCSFSLRSS